MPSDQLPWAQVMYPITAGGGQAAASQTTNLRQGNFVFGFFMDGQDMQVPVIMGVLGNNAQTALKTTTGTTDSNFGPTSGFAESSKGQTDPNEVLLMLILWSLNQRLLSNQQILILHHQELNSISLV